VVCKVYFVFIVVKQAEEKGKYSESVKYLEGRLPALKRWKGAISD
jgi:hypothetical protein